MYLISMSKMDMLVASLHSTRQGLTLKLLVGKCGGYKKLVHHCLKHNTYVNTYVGSMMKDGRISEETSIIKGSILQIYFWLSVLPYTWGL